MSPVERKLEKLRRLKQLREVWQRSPFDRDLLADLRIELEQEIGDTVSMRTAARFLGVSHTAVGRWVKKGAIPRIVTPTGKMEIPLNFLLDLREQLDDERSKGERSLHVLEAVVCSAMERAEELPLDDIPSVEEDAGHQAAEARSLAYHMVVAKRLNRKLVEEARYRVYRSRRSGKMHPQYASEWERILDRPILEIKKVLIDPDDKAGDLRQNSPFAGMLSEPERKKILSATTTAALA